MSLSKRTNRLRKDNDVTAPILEKIFTEFDGKINTLDRQISQTTELSDSATDAQVITKVNEIIKKLNASGLTS